MSRLTSPENRFFKTINKIKKPMPRKMTCALLAVGALVGCGDDGPYSTYKYSKLNPADFLERQFNNGKVQKCIGSALLREDGHVRIAPDALNKRGEPSETLVATYTRAAKDGRSVEITNPHLIQTKPNEPNGDVPSESWYLSIDPSLGMTLYINKSALSGTENITCEGVARADEPPKPISVGS